MARNFHICYDIDRNWDQFLLQISLFKDINKCGGSNGIYLEKIKDMANTDLVYPTNIVSRKAKSSSLPF